jgi:hypothetical protein
MTTQAAREASGKVVIEAYRADRDRLKALAGYLSEQGQGRFYQAETLAWLLDFRENAAAMLAEGEVGHP